MSIGIDSVSRAPRTRTVERRCDHGVPVAQGEAVDDATSDFASVAETGVPRRVRCRCRVDDLVLCAVRPLTTEGADAVVDADARDADQVRLSVADDVDGAGALLGLRRTRAPLLTESCSRRLVEQLDHRLFRTCRCWSLPSRAWNIDLDVHGAVSGSSDLASAPRGHLPVQRRPAPEGVDLESRLVADRDIGSVPIGNLHDDAHEIGALHRQERLVVGLVRGAMKSPTKKARWVTTPSNGAAMVAKSTRTFDLVRSACVTFTSDRASARSA